MMRFLLGAVGLVAFAYVAICAWLFFTQRSLIYFPQPRGNSAAATIKLATEGVDVLVTVRPREGAKALIYFGGNAEDVTLSLSELEQAFPDHALYLMHYRGYGGSGGTPSEIALQRDALALFDKVRTSHPLITLMGRSLGSGVATKLASERKVSGLVLITPYYSLQDIAAAAFPYWPVRWLLQDKFESWRYASRIDAPTLLIAAENDEIIPLVSTEKLLHSFSPGVARLEVVPDTGHNTIAGHARYVEVLRAFNRQP